MNLGATKEETKQVSNIIIHELNSPSNSIEKYRQILKIHPHNRLARYRKIILLSNQGMIDEAKEDLLYLDKQAPHYNGTHLARLHLFRITGQKDKEIDSIDKAAKDIREGYRLEYTLDMLKERKALLRREYKTVKSLINKRINNSADNVSSKIPQIAKTARLEEYFGNYSQAVIEVNKIDNLCKDNPDKSNQETIKAYILFYRIIWTLAEANRNVSQKDIANLKYALFPELKLHIAKSNMSDNNNCNISNDIRESSRELSRIAIIFYLMANLKLCNVDYGDDLTQLELSKVRFYTDNDPLYPIMHTIVKNNPPKVKKEAIRIAKILESAPSLEWARWAGLFLALSNKEAAGLLEHKLPMESLQLLYFKVHKEKKEEAMVDHGVK